METPREIKHASSWHNGESQPIRDCDTPCIIHAMHRSVCISSCGRIQSHWSGGTSAYRTLNCTRAEIFKALTDYVDRADASEFLDANLLTVSTSTVLTA